MKETMNRKVPIEEKEEKYEPSKGPRKQEKQERHFPGEKERQSIEDPEDKWKKTEEGEVEVLK